MARAVKLRVKSWMDKRYDGEDSETDHDHDDTIILTVENRTTSGKILNEYSCI